MICYNRLLNGYQPLHSPMSVQYPEPDYKVDNTNANQGILPESQNNQIQYTDVLKLPFQDYVPIFNLFYLCRGLNNGYYILKLNNMQW